MEPRNLRELAPPRREQLTDASFRKCIRERLKNGEEVLIEKEQNDLEPSDGGKVLGLAVQ